MTRGRVGILNPDGTVRSMYVACDGYVNGLGRKLVECYTTSKQINELIDLKAIQGVHKDPSVIEQMDLNAFHREPVKSLSINNFLFSEGFEDNESYGYLFKDNNWYCVYLNCEEIEPILVSELLKDKTIY